MRAFTFRGCAASLPLRGAQAPFGAARQEA